MKLFSQDDPAERAFQTCGKPCGPGGKGVDGTRRTEFTRRIRLLWNTPPGVNYFSLGATIVSRCCPLFNYILTDLNISRAQRISFGRWPFSNFLFLLYIYIYIFSIKLSIFGMIPRPLNFIRKIKIFPWVFFFFDYFIDNLILEMRKGVN